MSAAVSAQSHHAVALADAAWNVGADAQSHHAVALADAVMSAAVGSNAFGILARYAGDS